MLNISLRYPLSSCFVTKILAYDLITQQNKTHSISKNLDRDLKKDMMSTAENIL